MVNSQASAPASRLPARAWDGLGIALLIMVLAMLGWRQSHLLVIEGEPARSHELGRPGMADFRDVIYYPQHAVREAVNPYDWSPTLRPDGRPRYRQRYPVLNLFPLYSPLVLALFWPFGYGDFTTSAVAYMALNVCLVIALSWVCWRAARVLPTIGQVTALAGVMLATQAGRANFLNGQTGASLALASLGAIVLAPRHPWLAGLALAVTSFKPTFGLPLGILLLAAGHFRTVALGWGLGFVVGVAGLAIVFGQSGDLPRMLAILQENQATIEADPDLHAQTTPLRIDSAAAILRWSPVQSSALSLGVSLAILALAGAALWRLRSGHGTFPSDGLTTAIMAVATVACLYHQVYDGLLLWGAIAVLALAPQALWTSIAPRWRWAAAALVFVPMVNILSTQFVQRRYASLGLPPLAAPWSDGAWNVACTLNGLALFAALALLVWQASSTKGLCETA